MHRLIALLLLTAVIGCRHPVQLVGEHRLLLNLPPQNNISSVVEMPLNAQECCPAEGAKIAVVDVDGLLLNQEFTGPYSFGENPVSMFREKLEAIEANLHIRAVVLRINSPGGDVTSTDIMWRDLHAFRRRTKMPVVACLTNLGAGGAYYLATASDLIVAHPTTVTGGIGVILNLYNLQDTMALMSIIPQSVKAGDHIDMGTSTGPLSAQEREMLQGMADEFHTRFKHIVLQARPDVNPNDAGNFDGRVFAANEALKRRLIDRIGYLDDALAIAAELANVAEARAVLFRRRNDPARTIHSISPNTPLHSSLLPVNLPGLDRSRLPLFLYMWQPEATLQKLSGR